MAGVQAFEVRVQRIWVHEEIRMKGTDDHIDPDAWRPLIMSFQKSYGLGPQVSPSTWRAFPSGGTGVPTLSGPVRARRGS
ncbi:hypothetical protein [Nonomuraea sp. KM90]|uniref:hypothetical protein n=1 Tax=Nonomuraea sp. KM90 TaxID=3457428 RepID=UPI003FCE77B9